MKTQTLYKRLSLPLVLTVISATGIGVTPARSASLIGSHTAIDANPEATLIANCKPRINCEHPTINPIEKPSEQRQRQLEQQREQQQRQLEQQREQQQRQLEQQREQQQQPEQ